MVGRRGGGQHRGGGGRENSTDLSSSTSKKKQKDRANQESREAKRAAAAVDGVIAEVKKGELDRLCWYQETFVLSVRHLLMKSWRQGLTGLARWNVFQIPRIYLSYPSGKDPIKSAWKGETKLEM